MMFFIDNEFNGMGGGLLSMALVSECGRHEFYEVVQCSEVIEDWVNENVVPHLHKSAIDRVTFQKRLYDFLEPFQHNLMVVADFPDDIKYFTEANLLGPGVSFGFEVVDLRIDDRLHARESEIPHNALEDARAIRKSWKKLMSRI